MWDSHSDQLITLNVTRVRQDVASVLDPLEENLLRLRRVGVSRVLSSALHS